MYGAHTRFWPKFSGKKIFCFNFLIQLFIYLYLDTCFLCNKGILAFIFEHILWYKKFYVTNNSKTQERYKVFQVLPMYNVHSYFSFKNLGKKTVLSAKYGK